MSRRAKIAVVAALAGAFLLAGLLPFTLLALPNPPEYRSVETMSERGAYLRVAGSLFRLYPHPEQTRSTPEGIVSVGPDAELLVLSRRYDDLSRYRLRDAAGGPPAPLEAFVDEDRVLHLVPVEPLPHGDYVFESVEDSMYGELEYYYFNVAGDDT